MSFCVIILSRDASNLVPCVRAVQACEPDLAPARIIVVDDGARVEAEEQLRGVWWTRGEVPFVFARNANRGIQIAAPDDAILLNDDALLETSGGFTRLAQIAEQHPEHGIIAAACNNVGNVNQNRRSEDALRDEPRMVCFTCVYIPRRTIATVGLLDERYTDYGCDDDDYCFEIRKAGLKLGIYDGCHVDHKSLHSSFRGPAGRGGDYRPNLRRFIQKWGTDNWGRTKEQSQFKELFA